MCLGSSPSIEKKPILRAVTHGIDSVFRIEGAGRHRSAASIAMPPMMKAQPTTVVENNTRLMKSWAARPMTTAGRNANTTFRAKARAGPGCQTSVTVFHSF